MKFSMNRMGSALALSCALLAGCLPPGQSSLQEEKEPHFLAGKSRASQMDYNGAFESFEKALEVNPKSAAAHFELACLCEKNDADPAAAIYHYDHFLKLRPGADNAEVVKTRILACKQALARTVSFGTATQPLQREFERLTEENKRLHEEVAALRFSTNRSPAQTTPAATIFPARTVQSSETAQPSIIPVKLSASSGPRAQIASPTASHTYTIKAGDRPTTIARKHGVRVDALMAANPGLDSRRLQIGQTLNVPSP